MIFNAFLVHSFVPSDFYKGIVVPVMKCKHDGAIQLDMYRASVVQLVQDGITVTELIRGFFKLVMNYGLVLERKACCSCALFNESIKYFVSNQTTVYPAFPDASCEITTQKCHIQPGIVTDELMQSFAVFCKMAEQKRR